MVFKINYDENGNEIIAKTENNETNSKRINDISSEKKKLKRNDTILDKNKSYFIKKKKICENRIINKPLPSNTKKKEIQNLIISKQKYPIIIKNNYLFVFGPNIFTYIFITKYLLFKKIRLYGRNNYKNKWARNKVNI